MRLRTYRSKYVIFERLIEMGLQDEVENSYVLHEMESKMNSEDLQKMV